MSEHISSLRKALFLEIRDRKNTFTFDSRRDRRSASAEEDSTSELAEPQKLVFNQILKNEIELEVRSRKSPLGFGDRRAIDKTPESDSDDEQLDENDENPKDVELRGFPDVTRLLTSGT